MAFARVFSAQPVYLEATPVVVEADLSKGLHSFSIVGLADRSIDESRERVAAAVKNSGFTSPKHSKKRVLISLAPADVRKEGPRFDLPIALAYLIAAGDVASPADDILFLGELSLQGDLRPVHGVLPLARFAAQAGFSSIVVPTQNAAEAALIEDIAVFPADTLAEVVRHIDTTRPDHTPIHPYIPAPRQVRSSGTATDFKDVRGQDTAKRGLEIAAAGRHNIVLYGPPGTGKTMLARALPGILPPLTFEEALEATAIHSVAGELRDLMIAHPPFRAPHHSASHVAIVGGGAIPRPGEVTLAHRGVLFLDEFPEFERRVIDGLREPLEDRHISISRAKGTVAFPANFILVAAMNPNRERGDGRISDLDKEQLKKKISGPVVDRIDMWIEVSHIPHEELAQAPQSDVDDSMTIRTRVLAARTRQYERFNASGRSNGDMTVRDIDAHAALSRSASTILTTAAERYRFSPRSYHRTIKLARTIADLGSSDTVEENHILEALTYRPKLFDD